MIRASRYHDISVGHRVWKHESKCNHLHGHNYRIHFHCEANSLDDIGRVIDFAIIKEKLQKISTQRLNEEIDQQLMKNEFVLV